MDPMKELIDAQTVERALLALAVVGPLLGLLGGLGWSATKKAAVRTGALRGLAVGLSGPLVWLLWRLFSWLTRFQPAANPEQDYFGLERVDILLLNTVIFVAVGAAVGLAVRRIRERDARDQRAAEGSRGDSLGLNQSEMLVTSSGEEEAQQ
ncbi:MAG: hypothetical protein HZB16_06785 [Armatimonadetes bacterium]|nr:hypothetical protein [Armatimonadota bacterium]